jgi:virginiamycin B lyase
VKGLKRFRRQLAATAAALGVAGVVVGTAAAADQVTPITVQNNFSKPLGIVAGPDNNMWFADPGAQSIGTLVPGSSTPSLTPSPNNGGGPAGMTTGPGGLWYSEHDDGTQPPGVPAGANVGKIVGGVYTEYLLPGANNLQGIAQVGANMWVAEKSGDSLWRVTPDGAATEFGAGTVTNAQAVSRGPGSDPNVYVTSATGLRRTSSTSPGAPAPFGNALANAFGIVVGPDNNFWVTHPGGVAQMSGTTGALLGGGVSLPGSGSRGIAVGPDGALWFAEYSADRVGRVTTSGQFRDFAVPCDGPEGVAAGPDGAVYVTCYGTDPGSPGRTILRILPDGTVPPGGGVAPGGGGTVVPPPLNPITPKGSFTLKKKRVRAGAKFTVSVKFTQALNKSRVRVQYKHNKRGKGKINSYKTLGSKVVTGLKAGLSVKIGKPGVYLLRVGFANAGKQSYIKAVKVTVTPKPKR